MREDTAVFEKYKQVQEKYLIAIKEENHSDSTYCKYELVLNIFGSHLSVYKHTNLTEYKILRNSILTWKQKLLERGSKSNTVQHCLTVLRVFFDWAVKQSYYQANPLIDGDIPEIEKINLPTLTDEQIKQILNYEDKNKYKYLRIRTIVVLILQCGLQVNEIINLRIEDLDFENKCVFFINDTRKEEKTHTTFPTLSRQCVTDYIEYYFNKSDYKTTDLLFQTEFGERLTRQNITQRIKGYVKKIIGEEKIGAEDLRRTYNKIITELKPVLLYDTLGLYNCAIDKKYQPNPTTDIEENSSTSLPITPIEMPIQRTEYQQPIFRQPIVPEPKPIRHGKQLSLSEYAYSADDILSNPEAFSEELKEFDNEVKNNALKHIDGLDGYEFQDFIADLFQQMGYEANVNNKAYDWGVDIIVKCELFSIGIQCKISNSEYVDNNAVQEIVAGIRHYKLDKGMVIANNYFHKSTQILAQENNVILWDRDYLHKKIQELKRYSGA